MRKPFIVIATLVVLGTLTYCSSSKKAAAKSVAYYTSDIAPIMDKQCGPCHIPAQKGNKKPYDTYDKVKADIDAILFRVQLDSTDKRVMPKMKPHLDAATIALLKKWKEDGLNETKP